MESPPVAANRIEDNLMDVNERILKEIAEAYSDKVPPDTLKRLLTNEDPKLRPAELKPGEDGLMAICHKLGLACIAPRRIVSSRSSSSTPLTTTMPSR